MIFSINLGVIRILCRFILVPEGKTSKEITDSSRLKFLVKISGNHFASSDADENNLEVFQKVQQVSFGEMVFFCLLA